MDPINISSLELVEVRAVEDEKVRWTGGFYSYGGSGSTGSATIYFAIAAGERLGRHTDTVEETQFIYRGSGEQRLDEGSRQISAGDMVVLQEGGRTTWSTLGPRRWR